MPTVLPAPRAVRIVGVIVAVQGLAALVFAVAVLLSAFRTGTGRSQDAGNLYGEFGFFLVVTLGILAVAGGLLLGHRWSRTPAAVTQVLLILVAWYALSPSQLLAAAIVTVALCVTALVLLFTAPARAWAVTDPDKSA